MADSEICFCDWHKPLSGLPPLYFLINSQLLFLFVPGEYRVGIKFNDQHIPDSPYKLFISPAMGDAHKLEVYQFPEGGVAADKPAAFLARKNGAKGELDAKVTFNSTLLMEDPEDVKKKCERFSKQKQVKL